MRLARVDEGTEEESLGDPSDIVGRAGSQQRPTRTNATLLVGNTSEDTLLLHVEVVLENLARAPYLATIVCGSSTTGAGGRDVTLVAACVLDRCGWGV